jgi:hypothetical protein
LPILDLTYHPGLVEQLRAELTAARRELEWLRSTSQLHLQLAKRVHESLSPGPVRNPRLDVEARHLPLEAVGGDYCQVLFPDTSENAIRRMTLLILIFN